MLQNKQCKMVMLNFKITDFFIKDKHRHKCCDHKPASSTPQSVRSISLRLGQQVAIRFSPFSFIKEHDSNRKHSSILQLSAIESSALLVMRLQHVRSIVLRSLHWATRDEIPSSVTPLHLLSPISTNLLQLSPMAWRRESETSRPSSFNIVKVSFSVANLDRKRCPISYKYNINKLQAVRYLPLLITL